ncbi:DUF6232 family protein [Streptomyces sp. NPDC056883]|uniref:DUF6232 family protein n=1 Tax=Streptomyces sp. NPDC056883 TaxID=3345959 RepID=UPI00369940A1
MGEPWNPTGPYRRRPYHRLRHRPRGHHPRTPRRGGAAGPVLLAVLLGEVVLGACLVHRLTRPDLYVMGVETSGGTSVVVTLADQAELRGLVARIVDAIEHPEAEFSLHVARPTVNIKHYVRRPRSPRRRRSSSWSGCSWSSAPRSRRPARAPSTPTCR